MRTFLRDCTGAVTPLREVEAKFYEGEVDFHASPTGYTGPRIQLQGPVEYYIASLVVSCQKRSTPFLCVDVCGRNFGVEGSVLVGVEELKAAVEQWRPGLWQSIELAYARFEMNPVDLAPKIWEKLGWEAPEDIPNEFRVVVCGERTFVLGEPIERFLVSLKTIIGNSRTIKLIHGAAPGADTIAAFYGRQLFGETNVLGFPAAWESYGRSAGPIRNRLMLAQEPHLVAAFYEKDGPKKSVGTNDMVRIAAAKNVPVLKYEDQVGWY